MVRKMIFLTIGVHLYIFYYPIILYQRIHFYYEVNELTSSVGSHCVQKHGNHYCLFDGVSLG